MRLEITKHCKVRYKERVNPEYQDVVEILKSINAAKDITNWVLDNVPRYLLYLYERYKEFKLKIVRNQDIIYILKRKEGTLDTYMVLTCYQNDKYLEMYKNSTMKRSEIYLQIRLLKDANRRK